MASMYSCGTLTEFVPSVYDFMFMNLRATVDTVFALPTVRGVAARERPESWRITQFSLSPTVAVESVAVVESGICSRKL